MAKLPVTIIFIARRNSIPKWLDKYLTTHLKIHRPSWKIKSDRGRAFDVDILTEMATKEWMQDIEKYFKLWRDWAKTDPDMLPRLVGGAIVLQRLTRPPKDQVIVLQDDGAHLALVTCCALCLSPKKPAQELRGILEDTLNLLARCCPFEVEMESLPALSDLPPGYQTNPLVLEQYGTFPQSGDHQGVRELMLSDALVLYRIFEKAPNPPVNTLAQLKQITAAVRLSLQRIRKAAG